MDLQRETVRQRILTAAQTEFLSQGYQRASMRAIARRAGMTGGNLYLYFQSKEALFSALLEPVFADVRALIALPHRETLVGAADFESFAHALSDIYLGRREAFLILLERSAGSPYSQFRRQVLEAAYLRIRQALAHINPEAAKDDILLGPVVTGLTEGILSIYARHGDEPETLRLALRRFLPYMLDGLFAATEVSP